MKPDIITSVQNPRIKAVARLRERRERGKQGRIIIDGRRELRRALEAGVEVEDVFFCPALCGRDDVAGIVQQAAARGARRTEVTEAVLARIGYGDRAEGVVATAQRPRIGLADLRLGARPLIGVVERVEKPGNLGAILRSADGAGVEAVLVVDGVTDVFGPNVIRSSLGAVFCVPVVEAEAGEAVRWLKGRAIAVVAASPGADRAYTEVDLTGPVALVFGSEAEGLTGVWRRDAAPASIPMLGRGDSLNVSTTAALFFYEALRQRRSAAGNQGD